MKHRPPQIPPPHLVNTQAELNTLAKSLQNEASIALDTESNSLYAYQEQVCLIQLSTQRGDYLIDPIQIEDLSPLGVICADPDIEIVMHDAKYDIICLKRDFDFTFTRVFDTMFAARILGIERFGLAPMLEEYFDVYIDKAYQRANWGVRPLPADQLVYAQMDTHFLLALHDILYEDLVAADALTEAHEIFEEIAQTPAPSRDFDEEGYWRITGARQLSRRQIACLRELYYLREDIAQRYDLPPFKVLTDAKLIQLVENRLYSVGDLHKARIIKGSEIKKYGKDILKALARGRKADLPRRPNRHHVDRRVVSLHELLMQWRKERAVERGVESDIIMSREALWDIAYHRPRTIRELQDITGLGPWRTQAYGQDILRLLGSE